VTIRFPHRIRRYAPALALGVSLLGCAATRPHDGPPPVPPLYETQRRITEYVDSGRYEAEVAQVATAAMTWLTARAPEVDRPAIVLDIDETALSNWQCYRVNGWARIFPGECDLEHGPCGIRAWQTMGKSTALVPTLRLVDRARQLGVAIFFITGRPTELRQITEQNLHEQGFQWDGVILLPSDKQFASGVDFKAPERRRLTEQGYTIVLSMGDQQSDLDGGYAERTFKLPNPVYFLP
jgi:predicted secreted acid phosphatase